MILIARSYTQKSWYLFEQNTGFRAADRRGLTRPKPDGAFYFAVHERETRKEAREDSRTSSRWQWTGTPHGKLVENFSFDHIDRLHDHGLQYNCLISLDGERYRPKDFQCFPWLVIENKKGAKGTARSCYCQVANATSAALMLLQTAARFAENRHECQHVPPVLGISTVGELVRVWITYDRQEDFKHTYVSISMTCTTFLQLIDELRK